MSTIGSLTVLVGANTAGFTAGMATVNKGLVGLQANAAKSGGAMGTLGKVGSFAMSGWGLAAIGAAGLIVKAGIEAEQANAQTVAAIKSTGGAANVTLTDVQNLAGGIRDYSGISDEAVQAGANMLLSFKNIQNQAGANNDIFNQATTALADMQTRMANGAAPSAEAMSSGAIRLGKALNDPIAGMASLSRVGVQFTEQQKAQITAMVESGNVMGAQKVILAELTSEFGGSAAEMGKTGVGSFNILKESVMDVLEIVGVALLSVFKAIAPVLLPVLKVVAVAVKVVATVFGALVKAVLTPFKLIGAAVSWVADNFKALAPILAVVFAPFLLAIGLVKVAFAVIAQVAQFVFNAIKAAVAPLVPFFVTAWNMISAAFGAVWNTAVSIFNGFVNAIITGINFVIGVINGLIAAWNKVPFHDDVPLIKKLDHLGESANSTGKMLGGALTAGLKAAGGGFTTAQSAAVKYAGALKQTASITENRLNESLQKQKSSITSTIKALNQGLQAQIKYAKNSEQVSKRLTDAGVKDADKWIATVKETMGDQAPKLLAQLAKANDKQLSAVYNKWQKAHGEAGSVIGAVDEVSGAWSNLQRSASVITKTIRLNVDGAAVGSVIANFASGGRLSGSGWAVVGERGPELMPVRGGRVASEVVPNHRMFQMIGTGAGGGMGGGRQELVGTLDLEGVPARFRGWLVDELEGGALDRALDTIAGPDR